MLSYEEALLVVTGAADSEQTAVETVALEQSAGRWLAASQRAKVDVPGYDNSAMDGFAVRCIDIEPGRPINISSRIAAGDKVSALAPGTVARVFTGAAIPAGADAVVMQENTTINDDVAVVHQQPEPGQHIRNAGGYPFRRGRRGARCLLVTGRPGHDGLGRHCQYSLLQAVESRFFFHW